VRSLFAGLWTETETPGMGKGQAELVTTFKHKLKSKLFYVAYVKQPTVYSV